MKSDIATLRIASVHKHQMDIKAQKVLNQRAVSLMDTMRTANIFDTKYCEEKIDISKKKLEDGIAKIERLTDLIEATRLGKYDEQLLHEHQTLVESGKKLLTDLKQSKIKAKMLSEVSTKKYCEVSKNLSRSEKTINWDREYDYYDNISESIPEFIKEKLPKLPANEGYIWRGMTLYGELPKSSQICTLVEPKKGYTLVHTWNNNRYTIDKCLKRCKPERIHDIQRRFLFENMFINVITQSLKAKTATEPAKAVVEPAKAVVEPAKAVVEPAKAVVEPAKAVVEPAKAVVEPAKAVVEPAKAVVESDSDWIMVKRPERKHKPLVLREKSKPINLSKVLEKTQMCKYGKNCHRDRCSFAHSKKELVSKKCMYGDKCRKKDCTFAH
jgi:hypothetical protein